MQGVNEVLEISSAVLVSPDATITRLRALYVPFPRASPSGSQAPQRHTPEFLFARQEQENVALISILEETEDAYKTSVACSISVQK